VLQAVLEIVAGSLLTIAGREIPAAAKPDSGKGRQRQDALRASLAFFIRIIQISAWGNRHPSNTGIAAP
jgi:hypothetical protein